MSEAADAGEADRIEPWADAALAATLLAVDPSGLGGLCLRAPAGEVRDRWVALLRAALRRATPVRRLPASVPDSRLLGRLDLSATLAAGRPVAESGLLADADGGLLILPMAERITPPLAARLCAALDTGEVSGRPARLAVVALDEGLDDTEFAPAGLRDRCAFLLDLTTLTWRDTLPTEPGDPEAARARLACVVLDDITRDALADTATVLGVWSPRISVLAIRVALAAAALSGRDHVGPEDAAIATRLVLAPRATRLPADPAPPPDQTPPDDQQDDAPTESSADQPPPEPPPESPNPPKPTEPDPGTLEDMLIQAARAALPPALLDSLREAGRVRAARATDGATGAVARAGTRGRPAGTRAADPRDGGRMAVIDTLRAAAPWQRLRAAPPGGGIAIRREDFRVKRFQPRTGSTTIFVVDASGSSAANRLAEAKGAVELLLAECYVRRDQVAVIAFRGASASVLLEPTRALVRAKRDLAALPAGGGTPLAAGLDAAAALAEAVRRRGQTPVVVMLTDGRANVARDGTGGRARAAEDARAAARRFAALSVTSLLVDTSVRPHPDAAALALAMDARYLPLPFANAAGLSQAVRQAAISRG